MEVIEVKPKRTVEQVSLYEEQEQLTSKLVPIMEKDLLKLNELIDSFEETVGKDARGYGFEVGAALNELRQSADDKFYFLKTGQIEDQRHVNLVNALANKYHLDNKIR